MNENKQTSLLAILKQGLCEDTVCHDFCKQRRNRCTITDHAGLSDECPLHTGYDDEDNPNNHGIQSLNTLKEWLVTQDITIVL